MSNRGRIAILAAPAGVLACVLFFRDTPPVIETPAPQGLRETDSPKRRAFSQSLRWYGTVQPKESIRVIALEPGDVVSVLAADGALVTSGTPLFTLGGPLFSDRARVARAAVRSLSRRIELSGKNLARERKSLKTTVQLLEERVRLAEAVVARQQQLLSSSAGSAIELDLARSELLRLRAARETARFEIPDEMDLTEAEGVRLRTALSAAKAGLRRLELSATIRAQSAGNFVRRRVSPGQTVQPGEDLAMVLGEGLRIEATVFAPTGCQLAALAVEVELGSGQLISGRVERVLPETTPAGARRVWLHGEQLERRLSLGQRVTGLVRLTDPQEALAIPASALIYDERERAFAYVKTPGGFSRRPVETGREAEGWVEVRKGVGQDDVVVVSGAYQLYYEDFDKLHQLED